MNTNIEEIKNIPIGDNTARLIVNIRNLQNIYSEVYGFMESIYGYNVAESLFKDKFESAYFDLDKAIMEFLMLSIDDSLSSLTLKEI